LSKKEIFSIHTGKTGEQILKLLIRIPMGIEAVKRDMNKPQNQIKEKTQKS
jgi:hypothetical protein